MMRRLPGFRPAVAAAKSVGVLPQRPSQLRWMLAKRLGLAATLMGLAAAGISSVIETRRAEQTALANAEDGVRHFESSAVRMTIDAPTSVEHAALSPLLDRSRFIGIRVFSADRGLIFEEWSEVPVALKEAIQSSPHQHLWPALGQTHTNWMDLPGERLIQTVLPLVGRDGARTGYLEGISRLDRQAVDAQRDQVRNGALTAAAAVVVSMLLLYPLLLAMLRHSTELSGRLLESNISLMRSLGNAIAKRDSDTDAHNYRVTYYAIELAEAMQLPESEIASLVVGAFLHDVGKIGVPDGILLKPGQLTADEFTVMKTHVLLGIEIVDDDPWLKSAVPIIQYHHERFDGTGYPEGLRGDAIPIGARVFSVVDVFDALTSERPYKAAMAFDDALAIIEAGAGGHFDPAITAVFRSIAPSLYKTMATAEAPLLRKTLSVALSRYFRS